MSIITAVSWAQDTYRRNSCRTTTTSSDNGVLKGKKPALQSERKIENRTN
jgi:hypothetical protein